MQAETAALLDRNADPETFAARLSRLGSHFLVDQMAITALLDRHLIDEEEQTVSVILHHGPDGLG